MRSMRVVMAALVVAASPLFAEERTWTCPMHPDVHEHALGRCPVCGMTLVEEEAREVPALRVPHQRLASGTAWQPDTTPMRMLHLQAGEWGWMFHGAATLGWGWQGGPPGGDPLISTHRGVGVG